MGTLPIVIGVTPCCGNIMRTPAHAISRASHTLDLGICPDCDTVMSETPRRRDGAATVHTKCWFLRNAKVVNGVWKWSAADAFHAFVESQITGGTKWNRLQSL